MADREDDAPHGTRRAQARFRVGRALARRRRRRGGEGGAAEIIEFLRDPARFERLGARVPRGVLLHGPPGTGKTLLAKAVAAESGAAFFSQPASAFVEMFAGLGASRIRKLFDTARKHAPAIIFIDELDEAVGAARQNVGFNREQDQTLNQLLVELDGFKRSDVVIMASTNRLDTLDAALLRPGRFDRQVYVSPPDLMAREQILNVHVRNKPIDESVELSSVARATAGLTGADLENICNEAAIRAPAPGATRITAVDFDDALERVVAGLKTHRMVSEDEKRVIAYHEAGHAVLAHIVGRGMTIHKVTIVPRGESLGYNMYLPDRRASLATRDDLITHIVVLLGGRAGEQMALGRGLQRRRRRPQRGTAIARAMVSTGVSASRSRRARCAPTTSPSRRTRSGSVTRSNRRICDYAYAEARDCWTRTARRSSASPPSSWSARRSTARTSRRCCMTCSAWARSRSACRTGRRGPAAVPLVVRWLAAASRSVESSSSPALAISAFLASTAARASRTRSPSAPSSLLDESVPASKRSNAAAPKAATAALDLALRACAAAASAAVSERLPCPARGRPTPFP